jgi:hypothetical protein
MPASPWSSLPLAISSSTWRAHWQNNRPYGGDAIASEQMASEEGAAEQVASEEGGIRGEGGDVGGRGSRSERAAGAG